MIFTRAQQDFTTRLTINDRKIEKINVTKILGLWISEDLSWDRNTTEICRRAYSRMSMLTKLKYAGVSRDDLLDVYKLFIRSIAENCVIAFHSISQATDIERIQKVCLKIILGDLYTSYSDALELVSLQTLHDRREKRCLDFAKKCLKHPIHRRLFPVNNKQSTDIRQMEPFIVNFARTESYRKSAIPFCQRILNTHYQAKK